MNELITISDSNGSRRFVVLEKVNFAYAESSGFLKGKLYLHGSNNHALMVYEILDAEFEDLPNDKNSEK